MRIAKHVILSAALIAMAGGFAAANAQDAQQQAKPMFMSLPAHNTYNVTSPAPPVALTTWSSTYVYNTRTYPFTMVGKAPSGTGNHTANTQTFIIPIKVVVGSSTFDPLSTLSNGQTVVQNTAGSPIFVGSNWTVGRYNLPNRQYIDAYQIGSIFGVGILANNLRNYHVIMRPPTVLPEVTLTCGSPNCSVGPNPITGHGTVAQVNLALVDSLIQTTINSNPTITPGSFPIFLTYDTYLTEGGCCIGGYHSAYGGPGSQTYTHTTWIDPITCTGFCQFSEDVAAFSHETGEWVEDPYVNNPGCGGLLEVGDPLVEHDYVQTINTYNYHVQDLVYFPYFYQSPSQAMNGWYSFRNAPLSICSNGQ